MSASLKLNKKEKGCFILLFSIIFLAFIDVVFVPLGRMHQGPASKAMVQSRTVGLAIWQYAQDHAGKYPEGKTSTEVFQKLFDGRYVENPDIYYLALPGKVKCGSDGKVLKPENVCWDVTCCVDGQSPDGVPMVFVTGYKITYRAGASAVPLHPTDWWSTYFGNSYYGMAVTYKGNNSIALKTAPDGSIPNFIPADFDPKGKTYRQLTPDGELPP